jgi:hypothetical protein
VEQSGYKLKGHSVEMQDAQGYVARCTTLSTSSFCLVVWSARKEEYCHGVTGNGAKIEGMGFVVYKATLSNGSKTKITWQEVYYVPTFKVNITSTVETSLKGINEQVNGNVCRFCGSKSRSPVDSG